MTDKVAYGLGETIVSKQEQERIEAGQALADSDSMDNASALALDTATIAPSVDSGPTDADLELLDAEEMEQALAAASGAPITVIGIRGSKPIAKGAHPGKESPNYDRTWNQTLVRTPKFSAVLASEWRFIGIGIFRCASEVRATWKHTTVANSKVRTYGKVKAVSGPCTGQVHVIGVTLAPGLALDGLTPMTNCSEATKYYGQTADVVRAHFAKARARG